MAEPIRLNERPPGFGNRSLTDEALNNELDALEASVQGIVDSSLSRVTTPPFNLTVSDQVPLTVANVNAIEFDGATLTNDGARKVTVTIAPKKHTAFLHFFEGGGGSGVFDLTRQVDLSGFSEVRLHLQVNTAAGGQTARMQYSLDAGATWAGMDGGTEPEIDISSTGLKSSAWINLEAGAKADVLVRVQELPSDTSPDTDLRQRIFCELRGYGV